MTVQTIKLLTIEDFLNLPPSDITYELMNGEARPKMSPQFFHSSLTGALFILLGQWNQNRGRVRIEWSVQLTREGKDWVPVPDLLYISYNRLSRDWNQNKPCPIPPELVIEILSPGQTFGDMNEKATAYLKAGVDRVWVIDPEAKSITIFYPDAPPETKRGEAIVNDLLLEGLEIIPQQVFLEAGIS